MKSINDIEKKRGRGRPSTDATPVLVRVSAETLKRLDVWIKNQWDDPDLSRPEAIRRFVELGLKVKPKARPRADSQRNRAKELAGKAVDKMADAGATADDQASRRRRILEGPSSFRDVRVDRPKAKK